MHAIQNFATIIIFGRPVVFYFGIVTFLSFAATAAIAILNYKGIRAVPFKWHPKMAAISFSLAIIHALLAFSLYF